MIVQAHMHGPLPKSNKDLKTFSSDQIKTGKDFLSIDNMVKTIYQA